jgi:hypothetical protein
VSFDDFLRFWRSKRLEPLSTQRSAAEGAKKAGVNPKLRHYTNLCTIYDIGEAGIVMSQVPFRSAPRKGKLTKN